MDICCNLLKFSLMDIKLNIKTPKNYSAFFDIFRRGNLFVVWLDRANHRPPPYQGLAFFERCFTLPLKSAYKLRNKTVKIKLVVKQKVIADYYLLLFEFLSNFLLSKTA